MRKQLKLNRRRFRCFPLLIALCLCGLGSETNVAADLSLKEIERWRTPRESPQKIPFLKDFCITAFHGSEKTLSMSGSEMWVRSRCVGDVVFPSLKEIVVTRCRVVATHVQDLGEILTWAKNPGLISLLSPMLVDTSFKTDLARAAVGIVIEDLEVYADIGKGQEPWLALSAKRMVKEPFLDELHFAGPLQINLGPEEQLRSECGARWLPFWRSMVFQEVFLWKGEPWEGCRFTLAGRKIPGSGEITDEDTILDPAPAFAENEAGGPSGLLGDTREIRRHLKKHGRKGVESLVWQLLAVNPAIFQQMGISPMLLMGPGPALGEFKPTPFLPVRTGS